MGCEKNAIEKKREREGERKRGDDLSYFHEQVPGVVSAHVDCHVRYNLIRGLETRAKDFHDANDRIELNSSCSPANPTPAMGIVSSLWNHPSLFHFYSFFLDCRLFSEIEGERRIFQSRWSVTLAKHLLEIPQRVYLTSATNHFSLSQQQQTW